MARIKDNNGFQAVYIYPGLKESGATAEFQDRKTGEYFHIDMTHEQLEKFIAGCQQLLEKRKYSLEM